MSKPFDAHYKWKELGSEHAKNERCKQGNFYERKKKCVTTNYDLKKGDKLIQNNSNSLNR